jgi:drug/metabolite transporter (DMT)-like permease
MRHGLVAVLLWSTVATAFKLALAHVRPVGLLVWSSIVSTVFLGVYLGATGGLRAALRCSRRALARSALAGLMNPFLYYLVLFAAYDRLPAQEAQPINYTWAIVLSILSVPLLGRRLRARDLLAAFVCYAGVFVISTRGEVTAVRFSEPVGVALALGSTVIWAMYWIVQARDERGPAAALFVAFLFGTAFTVTYAAFAGALGFPSWRGALGAAYVGLFEMGLTFVLWSKAMRAAPNTSRVANLIFLSPPLSLVFIAFVLGEDILASSLVGLALILGGLALQHGQRPRGAASRARESGSAAGATAAVGSRETS